MVTDLAGVTGQPGLVDGANLSTNMGGVQFSFPTAIAVANDGATLYIVDQGNGALRQLSSNNAVSTLVTGFQYNFVNTAFRNLSGVAVDANSNIWVADSYYQVICVISNGTATAQVVAGTPRVIGTNDSSAVTGAQFKQPTGLLWDTNNNLLAITDTGNATVRTLFWTNYQGTPGYYVQTVAGVAEAPGFVNGALGVAQFNQPFGMCIDLVDSGYYVVDMGNNALRVLQPTVPPPPPQPVTNPVIGYVTFPLVNGLPSAQFNPITAVDIGQLPSGVPSLNVPTIPALTLESISQATGRPSSAAVSVQIQYVTANPNIVGLNPEAITLIDNTANAQMWYTLDGSIPVPGAANTFPASSTVGITSGQLISFNPSSNTTLTVQAFTSNAFAVFAPSGTVTAQYSPSDFVADEITFGFATGEASSQFITAPGQTFIAPVTMSLIPSADIMYTLQFNLAITNLTANGLTAPPVPTSGSNSITFSSMLMQQFPGPVYYPIPPEMVAGFILTTNVITTNVVTNGVMTNLLFTNTTAVDLLGVGWVERPPATNLYNTKNQTLISYSIAHDTVFLNTGGQIVVGGFSFTVPSSASDGEQYAIQVGSPSATSDGITTPVFIETPTNGSLTNGPVNSTKIVTVRTNLYYLVGDVAPFHWFNAGDFGDTNLQNNDVTETFQTAVYGVNGPDLATLNSDYFDAMDSSNGTTNNQYDPNSDSVINTILYGDHVLAVDDVYVTYRRSLDPSLVWVYRQNTSKGKVAFTNANLINQPFGSNTPAIVSRLVSSGPRSIVVTADQVQTTGNLSLQVPVRVLAADSIPITVMMLRVEVEALDGSPPLTTPISFSGVTNLGTLFTEATQGPNDYAAAWLNSDSVGVSGTNILGALSVTLPSNVTTNSAYRVHFDHFSASPNGIGLFKATVQDGLITVGNRSASSWNDGIPDSWRLLWFGTVSNALSAANADPDGDGASNWQEYVAGTNPNDPASVFQFSPVATFAPSNFTLQWPSVVNKHYTVQCASSLGSANWTTLATNISGTGQTMQWTDSNAPAKSRFYRALVQ